MLNKKVIRSYISLSILVLIILVPIFVLYRDIPLGSSLSPWPVLFSTLGKLSGLLGLSMFSLALLMSSRFVWLDKLFYGLPKVINIHRWLGTLSFTFIIVHPLFLAARLLPVSSQLAWSVFTQWSQAAYLYGYVSLLVFMALVIMTFFWRLRYERLKSLHSLLAVPLMIGGIHSLLIDSDVKRIPLLAVYYILLISLSVIFYLVRLFLVDYGIKAQRFVLSEAAKLNANTISLTLKPSKKIINCQPGQFIFVSFPQIQKGEEHPFSVAAIHEDGSLNIITKTLGDYTASMAALQVGSVAMVDGPYGRFGDNADHNCHQVWIAGGIGITPFISMAQSCAKVSDAYGKVDLIYAAASASDFAALDTLRAVESSCPRFKLSIHASDQDGRFDMAKLNSLINDPSSCHFYICGPAGMIKYFVDALKKAKVPNSHINIEAFKLL